MKAKLIQFPVAELPRSSRKRKRIIKLADFGAIIRRQRRQRVAEKYENKRKGLLIMEDAMRQHEHQLVHDLSDDMSVAAMVKWQALSEQDRIAITDAIADAARIYRERMTSRDEFDRTVVAFDELAWDMSALRDKWSDETINGCLADDPIHNGFISKIEGEHADEFRPRANA